MKLFFVVTLFLFQIIILNGQDLCLKGFELLDDFEKNKSIFSNDYFSWQRSGNSGTVITYVSKDRKYVVAKINLFLESGKIESTYWIDKNRTIQLAKYEEIVYDEKWDKATKAMGRLEYIVYELNGFKRYDLQRKEINDEQNAKIKTEIDGFFKDATKGIKW